MFNLKLINQIDYMANNYFNLEILTYSNKINNGVFNEHSAVGSAFPPFNNVAVLIPHLDH